MKIRLEVEDAETGAPFPGGAEVGWPEALVHLARAGSPREAQQWASVVRAQPESAPHAALVDALLERAREHERLSRLCAIDELTGIANRRGFADALRRELARVRRGESTLALLLLDVDDLKLVNDRYGHPAGDRALRAVASCASEAVRHGDLLARIGGDEFAIVLPGAEREEARNVGERVREKLRSLALPGQPLGVSLGVAVTSAAGSCDDHALLCAADTDLYRDKRARHARRVAG